MVIGDEVIEGICQSGADAAISLTVNAEPKGSGKSERVRSWEAVPASSIQLVEVLPSSGHLDNLCLLISEWKCSVAQRSMSSCEIVSSESVSQEGVVDGKITADAMIGDKIDKA